MQASNNYNSQFYEYNQQYYEYNPVNQQYYPTSWENWQTTNSYPQTANSRLESQRISKHRASSILTPTTNCEYCDCVFQESEEITEQDKHCAVPGYIGDLQD